MYDGLAGGAKEPYGSHALAFISMLFLKSPWVSTRLGVLTSNVAIISDAVVVCPGVIESVVVIAGSIVKHTRGGVHE